MKKIIFILLFLGASALLHAQVPQAINYQAVARDNGGNILSNKNISLRISIIDSAANGVTAYVETHKLFTNQLGLFSLKIGKGVFVSGSFANIDWSTGKKWVKIEMDPSAGNNFITISLSELISVPYALYAAKAKTADNDLDTDPTNELLILTISNDTLFLSNGGFVKLPLGGKFDPTLIYTSDSF